MTKTKDKLDKTIAETNNVILNESFPEKRKDNESIKAENTITQTKSSSLSNQSESVANVHVSFESSTEIKEAIERIDNYIEKIHN